MRDQFRSLRLAKLYDNRGFGKSKRKQDERACVRPQHHLLPSLLGRLPAYCCAEVSPAASPAPPVALSVTNAFLWTGLRVPQLHILMSLHFFSMPINLVKSPIINFILLHFLFILFESTVKFYVI